MTSFTIQHDAMPAAVVRRLLRVRPRDRGQLRGWLRAVLGIDVRFDPGPVLEKPLRSAADIRALRVPADAASIAPEVSSTLRLVKPQLDPGVALIGFGGAPLSIAAYLVQGGGGKDLPPLRAVLASDPAAFGHLMETLSTLVARYLIEQSKAGADVVQIFDSWAGLLSLEQWTAHVRPHLVNLLDEVGRAGVPRILFANGAPHLVDAYAALPSEGLAVCWRTDLPTLRARVGNRKALQGNLDPALLLAGPDVVTREARAFLARMPAQGHIVNLGHGITPDVPLESVQALCDVVRQEGGS